MQGATPSGPRPRPPGPGEDGTGLILADAWGGEILRMPGETKLAGARRKAMTLKFARDTARRLQGYRDPGGPSGVGFTA